MAGYRLAATVDLLSEPAVVRLMSGSQIFKVRSQCPEFSIVGLTVQNAQSTGFKILIKLPPMMRKRCDGLNSLLRKLLELFEVGANAICDFLMFLDLHCLMESQSQHVWLAAQRAVPGRRITRRVEPLPCWTVAANAALADSNRR